MEGTNDAPEGLSDLLDIGHSTLPFFGST